METGNRLARVIQSLSPETQEDMALLRTVLACAQTVQKRTHGDLALRGGGGNAAVEIKVMTGISPVEEAERFLLSLPSEARKYFDGLVEAFEIYHSIHGVAPALSAVGTRSDRTLQELRQIRDLCLEEGLRSVF